MTLKTLYPRIGHRLIIEEITENSRVLDLGCGDGALLEALRDEKHIDGHGVEISSEGVSICLEKGLYCYQGDVDEGLSDYQDNSFDYVILNQTLQVIKKPEYVLKEIMRIGQNAVITFPNYAYYRIRLHHLLKGTMAKNSILPYDWFRTPNIHVLTIKDFQYYCSSRCYPIKKEKHFTLFENNRILRYALFPNLFSQYGFFILDGEKFTGNIKKNGSL